MIRRLAYTAVGALQADGSVFQKLAVLLCELFSFGRTIDAVHNPCYRCRAARNLHVRHKQAAIYEN